MNMKIQLLFATFLAVLSFMHGVHSTTFNIRNNCPFNIAPGTLTSSGPWPSTTGFELSPGASGAIYTPATWSGRIFARFQCSWNGGRYSCRSADCGSGQLTCNGNGAAPPATLAEFTLAGSGGKDFYDVSLVDGFNLPISIVPVGNHLAGELITLASSGGEDVYDVIDGIKLPSSAVQLGSSCPISNCPVDINAQCPGELAVRDPAGGTIGCKSACLAFNTPEYCCTGAHSTPQTCPASNYAWFFKNLCPKAYSYAYDDSSSTFTCGTGVNYDITFCP